MLPHELSIRRRQAQRPQPQEADRLFLAALSRALPRPAWSAFSVGPRTLLPGTSGVSVSESSVRTIMIRHRLPEGFQDGARAAIA